MAPANTVDDTANKLEGSISKGLTGYLDILRVGAYFGLLYLIVRWAIPSDGGPNLGHAMRVAVVVLYLVFDSAVRRVNRDQIDEQIRLEKLRPENLALDQCPSKLSVAVSGWMMLVEMLGVAMFALWAVGFIAWNNGPPPSDLFTPDQLAAFGLFALLAAGHNAIHIVVCPGAGLRRYFREALFGDAFQISELSSIWIGRLGEKEDRLRAKNDEDLVAALADPATSEDRLERYLRIRRGLFHLCLQFSALHVVCFNAFLGVILLLVSFKLIPSESLLSLNTWFPYPVILGLLASTSYSYWKVSECELKRPAVSEPGRLEKAAQKVGNLGLLLLVLMILSICGFHNAIWVLLSFHVLIISVIIRGS